LAILEQLVDNPRWPEEDPDVALEEAYETSPRTILKTFQDVLSPKTARIAFQRSDTEVKEKDYSSIVIDPERITPTLLRNLGLDQFIPPKGKRIKPQDRMAFMARAIPAIREMLQYIEPLDLPHRWHKPDANYFRLMRMGKGKNRGYVLGTQEITDQQTVEKRKILFKTDAHGADRRLDHIMRESYAEEIRIIKKIQADVLEIHGKLKKNWPMTVEEISKTRDELLALVDTLEYVTDENKVMMREKINACVSLQTSRKISAKFDWLEDGTRGVIRPEEAKTVYNPGATRAKLVTVPTHGDERIENISGISRYLGRDKIISQNFIAEQQVPFEKFYAQVEALHSRFAILNLSKDLSPEKREKIRNSLKELRDQCNPEGSSTRRMPLLQPYLAFGEKMVEHIDKAMDLLDHEDSEKERKEVATEFTKMYLVAKIQHFYIGLQKFYAKYLSPKGIPNFGEAGEELNNLEGLIKGKRVTAKVSVDDQEQSVVLETREYDDVYHAIYALLTDLKMHSETASIAQNEVDVKQTKSSMYKLVRNFRFDELLNKMNA
jgi:hypothetical protein